MREALELLKFAGVFAAEPLEACAPRSPTPRTTTTRSSDGLYITRITFDGGPGGGFTKRLDPRAQGRAAFKRKRMSHVTIAVGPEAPKRQPKQRSGAAIGLKTRTQRQAQAATTKPKTKTKAKSAAPRRKKQTAAAGAGA